MHAHQCKRARRELKFLRIRLGGRQGPGTLRVWLQSRDCHACHRAERRAVRAACQGPARQSLCRPHPRSSSPISKSSRVSQRAASTATRAIAATTIPTRLNYPTGSRSGSAARFAGSPKPSAARCSVRRRRAHDWPSQGRPPDAPQLSQGPRRRPHQRRACRRRLHVWTPPKDVIGWCGV